MLLSSARNLPYLLVSSTIMLRKEGGKTRSKQNIAEVVGSMRTQGCPRPSNVPETSGSLSSLPNSHFKTAGAAASSASGSAFAPSSSAPSKSSSDSDSSSEVRMSVVNLAGGLAGLFKIGLGGALCDFGATPPPPAPDKTPHQHHHWTPQLTCAFSQVGPRSWTNSSCWRPRWYAASWARSKMKMRKGNNEGHGVWGAQRHPMTTLSTRRQNPTFLWRQRYL